MSNYFIRARWWRRCAFMPQESKNLTISEHPQDWLDRAREDLKKQDNWTDVEITLCCPVSESPARTA